VRAPKGYANSPKENTMNRHAALAMATAALLCFAAGLSASDVLAQQTLLKEQFVDTRPAAMSGVQVHQVWKRAD
jgi:BioD-like phosphotransacetylase family protein